MHLFQIGWDTLLQFIQVEIKPILQSVWTCFWLFSCSCTDLWQTLQLLIGRCLQYFQSAVGTHKLSGSKEHKNLHMLLDLGWNYLLHVFVDYFEYSEQTTSLQSSCTHTPKLRLWVVRLHISASIYISSLLFSCLCTSLRREAQLIFYPTPSSSSYEGTLRCSQGSWKTYLSNMSRLSQGLLLVGQLTQEAPRRHASLMPNHLNDQTPHLISEGEASQPLEKLILTGISAGILKNLLWTQFVPDLEWGLHSLHWQVSWNCMQYKINANA